MFLFFYIKVTKLIIFEKNNEEEGRIEYKIIVGGRRRRRSQSVSHQSDTYIIIYITIALML